MGPIHFAGATFACAGEDDEEDDNEGTRGATDRNGGYELGGTRCLGRGGLFSRSEIINILSGRISDSFLFDPFKIPTISQLETRAQRPKVRRAAQEKKKPWLQHIKGPWCDSLRPLPMTFIEGGGEPKDRGIIPLPRLLAFTSQSGNWRE